MRGDRYLEARAQLHHAEAALTRAMSDDQWVHENELKCLRANVDRATAALEWVEKHEPRDDRSRLVKLLGMLGSDHAGERASAGLAADQLVRSKGLSWADVVSLEA